MREEGIAARVHNAGVSGDTTTSGLARLPRVLSDLPAKPDLVILELGANDMLFGVEPARTRANLDAMLTEFARLGMPVLLAGMKAVPILEPRYVRAFNAIFASLAAQHKVPLYPFFMAGVVEDRALRMFDGVHPTAEGVAVIVRRVLPMVKTAISRSD